jgi:hypothetical protein
MVGDPGVCSLVFVVSGAFCQGCTKNNQSPRLQSLGGIPPAVLDPLAYLVLVGFAMHVALHLNKSRSEVCAEKSSDE